MADLQRARQIWRIISRNPGIAQAISAKGEIMVVAPIAEGSTQLETITFTARRVSVVQVMFDSDVVDTVSP